MSVAISRVLIHREIACLPKGLLASLAHLVWLFLAEKEEILLLMALVTWSEAIVGVSGLKTSLRDCWRLSRSVMESSD